MNDQEIYDQLLKGKETESPVVDRPGGVRPFSLIVAFSVIVYLSVSLGYPASYSMSPDIDRFIHSALQDLKFNALTAVVFWMCLRDGKTWSIQKWTPIVCLVFSFLFEQGFHPDNSVQFPLLTWTLVYRLALIGLIFEIARRSFRISLQPANEASRSAPELRLSMLLWGTFVFASLMFFDWHVRHQPMAHYATNLITMPPGLAMVSALTRTLVWLGFGLILSNGGRLFRIAGILVVCLWAISRATIVTYLIWVHGPKMAILLSRTYRELSTEMLIAIQIFQFCFAGATCLFFLWTGYRFRSGSQSNPEEVESNVSFDDIR